MVPLPFEGLPRAAALPALALSVLLMPTSGEAHEFTAEPQPERSGLRWVADDPPAHRAIADQVVAAPQTLPATPPPIPSSSRVATGSGLVRTVEDELTPLLAVDGRRDSEQSLSDPPRTDRSGKSPLAAPPGADPPPPVPAIASGPSHATPSGLVWTAEDEPTPLVVLDPRRDFPQSLTGTTPDLAQESTDVAESAQPPPPIPTGLRWVLDDEFSALVAANPASSPGELLAAAGPRMISVETVVEQLELASHHPSFSPEDIASLLVQPKSLDFTGTAGPPANPANELISINSHVLATTGSETGFISINQQGSTDIDSQSLKTGLLDVKSAQIMDNKSSPPWLTVQNGQRSKTDYQGNALIEHGQIETSTTVVSSTDLTMDRRQSRLDSFSLEPILLSQSAHSDFRQRQTVRTSDLTVLIPFGPQLVVADRPVRRTSAVPALGIGFQLVSW